MCKWTSPLIISIWFFVVIPVRSQAIGPNNQLNRSADISPVDRFQDSLDNSVEPLWNPINRTMDRNIQENQKWLDDLDYETEFEAETLKSENEQWTAPKCVAPSVEQPTVDPAENQTPTSQTTGMSNGVMKTVAGNTTSYSISDTTVLESKLIFDEPHIKPICFVSDPMRKHLSELILKREKYLFDRWVPGITMNAGASSGTAWMDNSYSRNMRNSQGSLASGDYPGVSLSFTLPVYNPDLESSRDARRQNYLNAMMSKLRNIEYLQMIIKSYSERHRLLREKKRVEIIGIGNAYQIEEKILSAVTELNCTIRFFEGELDIDMCELKNKVEISKGKEEESSWWW